MELICCICGKVKRSEGWIEARPAPGALLSHGYCPPCTEAAMREIRDWAAKRAEGSDQGDLAVA